MYIKGDSTVDFIKYKRKWQEKHSEMTRKKRRTEIFYSMRLKKTFIYEKLFPRGKRGLFVFKYEIILLLHSKGRWILEFMHEVQNKMPSIFRQANGPCDLCLCYTRPLAIIWGAHNSNYLLLELSQLQIYRTWTSVVAPIAEKESRMHTSLRPNAGKLSNWHLKKPPKQGQHYSLVW